jgi:hypothetical protein
MSSLILALIVVSGCAADQAAQESLDAGFTSVANARHGDELSDAIARAS